MCSASLREIPRPIPAEAPETLPKTTRTFRLTQDDLDAIEDVALEDGTYAVSFRVAVKGDSPEVTIA